MSGLSDIQARARTDDSQDFYSKVCNEQMHQVITVRVHPTIYLGQVQDDKVHFFLKEKMQKPNL